jgi:hypothetical protein
MIYPPGFEAYDFPSELAKDIIAFSQRIKPMWKDSLLAGESSPQPQRTSTETPFKWFSPDIKNKLKDLLISYSQDYCANHPNADLRSSEGVNLLKYEQGQYFDYHSDAAWNIYRTTSVIVYLNPTEYQGGETYFQYYDVSIKPQTPSAVFFPSNYVCTHKAMPVTSGEKFVLVTWLNDVPYGEIPHCPSKFSIK